MATRPQMGLRFSNGLLIGPWDMPDEKKDVQAWRLTALEIGHHVALEMLKGTTGVEFVDMGAPGFAPGSRSLQA